MLFCGVMGWAAVFEKKGEVFTGKKRKVAEAKLKVAKAAAKQVRHASTMRGSV